MKSVQERMGKPGFRGKIYCAIACFLALSVIGLIDYWADYRILFTLLYVLPIGFATVFVSRWYAIFLSFMSVLFWTGGDIIAGAPIPNVGIKIWNDAIVLSLLLIIVFLLDALQQTLTGLEETVETRTEALRAEMEERHFLEKATLEISERERQTFGQELHDVVCQELASIGIASHLLEKKLQARDLAEAERAREIAVMVDHALKNARGIAQGFFIAGFDVMGLAEALRECARNVRERNRIDCTVHWQENLVLSNEEAVRHFLRIAQEAIQNAIKHGAPSRITVSLGREGDSIRLAIEDDGNGFSAARPPPKGLGLRIMAYRAELIGGELKIESPSTGGTRVICVVPVNRVCAGKTEEVDYGQNGAFSLENKYLPG